MFTATNSRQESLQSLCDTIFYEGMCIIEPHKLMRILDEEHLNITTTRKKQISDYWKNSYIMDKKQRLYFFQAGSYWVITNQEQEEL